MTKEYVLVSPEQFISFNTFNKNLMGEVISFLPFQFNC